MSERVTELTADDFEDRLDPGVPHLIDFWADWCTPCHQMPPILEAVAESFGDRVRISKLDVVEQAAIGERYGITSLPTFIIFQNGEPVRRFSGAKRQPQLERELHAVLDQA